MSWFCNHEVTVRFLLVSVAYRLSPTCTNRWQSLCPILPVRLVTALSAAASRLRNTLPAVPMLRPEICISLGPLRNTWLTLFGPLKKHLVDSLWAP
jgi:hypothetical protein